MVMGGSRAHLTRDMRLQHSKALYHVPDTLPSPSLRLYCHVPPPLLPCRSSCNIPVIRKLKTVTILFNVTQLAGGWAADSK